MAGDLRSPVSRFRLTNGGPRYSDCRKTARATRKRERDRKTSGLRRIVENKAMGLDFFLLFLKFWIMDELRLLTMNIFEI